MSRSDERTTTACVLSAPAPAVAGLQTASLVPHGAGTVCPKEDIPH